MARNTNLQDALFPVGFADVFIDGITNGESYKAVRIPVDKYHAIINLNNADVLCVVTKDYRLITNEEALELGKECYKQIFNIQNTENFEVFNVITSSTKTICHIDAIHKGYEVNIWKQETYLPYIRITNSYNRTRALSFDLGFCRKLCDNGVIFEKEAIRFSLYHTRQVIKEKIEFHVLPDKLEKLKRKFIDYSKNLSEFLVAAERAMGLMCKVLDIKFNLEKEGKELEKEKKRRDEFIARAGSLLKNYYKQSGPNAYAVFNACTDYGSHTKSGNVTIFADSIQRKIGNWVESFSEDSKKDDFNLEKYIGEYGKYLN